MTEKIEAYGKISTISALCLVGVMSLSAFVLGVKGGNNEMKKAIASKLEVAVEKHRIWKDDIQLGEAYRLSDCEVEVYKKLSKEIRNARTDHLLFYNSQNMQTYAVFYNGEN